MSEQDASINAEPFSPLSSEERNWGMACHLSAFAGCFFPFGSLIGPLIIWLAKKNEFSFVDEQGKEALNFQLTMLIAKCVSAILIIIFVGIIFLGVLVIIDLVFTIIAAIKASEGISYRYPFAIRLIT